MSRRLKDHLWFIQFSLWRAIGLYLLAKVTLTLAVVAMVYAAAHALSGRASLLLPFSYWMAHHGLSSFYKPPMESTMTVKSAINLLAVCTSGAYCLHRALRHFSQGGQHQSASLISEQS